MGLVRLKPATHEIFNFLIEIDYLKTFQGGQYVWDYDRGLEC